MITRIREVRRARGHDPRRRRAALRSADDPANDRPARDRHAHGLGRLAQPHREGARGRGAGPGRGRRSGGAQGRGDPWPRRRDRPEAGGDRRPAARRRRPDRGPRRRKHRRLSLGRRNLVRHAPRPRNMAARSTATCSSPAPPAASCSGGSSTATRRSFRSCRSRPAAASRSSPTRRGSASRSGWFEAFSLFFLRASARLPLRRFGAVGDRSERRDQRLDGARHVADVEIGDSVGRLVIGRHHRPPADRVRDDPLQRERVIVRPLEEILLRIGVRRDQRAVPRSGFRRNSSARNPVIIRWPAGSFGSCDPIISSSRLATMLDSGTGGALRNSASRTRPFPRCRSRRTGCRASSACPTPRRAPARSPR